MLTCGGFKVSSSDVFCREVTHEEQVQGDQLVAFLHGTKLLLGDAARKAVGLPPSGVDEGTITQDKAGHKGGVMIKGKNDDKTTFVAPWTDPDPERTAVFVQTTDTRHTVEMDELVLWFSDVTSHEFSKSDKSKCVQDIIPKVQEHKGDKRKAAADNDSSRPLKKRPAASS
mmetsp:Transcript_8527/g.14563  ORF Transcript_8527/g.14563 Transcript_8527/m.14563 type:complete len:171 (+) Transcript_8527:1-513(+)